MSGTMMLSANSARRTLVMTKIVKRSREHDEEHTHQKGKSSHHECVSGHDHVLGQLSVVDLLNLVVSLGSSPF